MERAKWVYLDGTFTLADEARISPFDRGFLFAQAAYEVTAVFDGKLIDFDRHIARLKRTLAGLEITYPELDLVAVHQEMMVRNELTEGLIYLQVTAGNQGPRDFYGPETLSPSVFMFATHKALIGDAAANGIRAITLEDTRWKQRDLKTTQLLSQSLAYRAARRAGAETTILHENGFVTEAASANLWIVTRDGGLVTRDLSPALLPGITRHRLTDLLEAESVSVEERAFTLDELKDAREVFTSSTGMVIAPVISIDGVPVEAGTAGPVTRKVQRAYYAFVGADLEALSFL